MPSTFSMSPFLHLCFYFPRSHSVHHIYRDILPLPPSFLPPSLACITQSFLIPRSPHALPLTKEIHNSTSPSHLELLISNHFSSWQTLSSFLPQNQTDLSRIFIGHDSFLCIIPSIQQRRTVLIAKCYSHYYSSWFAESLSGNSHSQAFLQHAFTILALSHFI